MADYLFTSESVGEGHPDKVCDIISDTVLDYFLAKDEESRVAIECFVKNNFLLIGGEVSSKHEFYSDEVEKLVREKIRDIGYDDEKLGFSDKCNIRFEISSQSKDIALGVDSSKKKEQGAGDQGIMFGYATDETPSYLPLPIHLSHKILEKLSELRKSDKIKGLRPDSKAQVTVEYANEKPKRVHTIVVSSQHDENISNEQIKKEIIEKVIRPICGDLIDSETKYHINPTGKFVIGGPAGDTGLTGRKIIVDTYGGYSRHGGGCFSGKDASKVDRSGAYASRYIAKNVVASGVAEKCEVQLAYAIGVAEPISIYIDCFGTNKIPIEKIIKIVENNFPLKPADIIRELDLKKPIYAKTACYGHFGRKEEVFKWETLDKKYLFH